MKKNLFLMLLLALGAMVTVTSCGDDDPCKDVECGANGGCFDGSCVCNVGYEGGACDTEWSAKFIAGSYSASETCVGISGTFEYTGDVSRISESKIKINEFGGFTGPNFIEADVKLETEASTTAEVLTINYTDAVGRIFTGTGKIVGKVLTITYHIKTTDSTGAVEEDDCVAVITLP